MRKVFLAVILVFFSLVLFGCSGTITQEIKTSEEPSTESIAFEKHIVSLTLDNYQKFFTISRNTVGTGSYDNNLSGALSYAYYDNVVITYLLVYQGRGETTETEHTLNLNVGGCGTIHTTSSQYGSTTYRITGVSGTVIYWI